MVHLRMFMLTYAALVCQTGLRDVVAIHGIAPDYLALIVVAAVFSLHGASAVLWAAVAGLLADCLGTGPLGIHMLLATSLAYAVHTCVTPEWRTSAVVQVVVGFLIVVSLVAGSSAAAGMLAGVRIDVEVLAAISLQTAVYSCGLGLCCCGVWRIVGRAMPGSLKGGRARADRRWGVSTR